MQYFTQTGLVSDICGTIGLFFYGLPSKAKSTFGPLLMTEELENDKLHDKKFLKPDWDGCAANAYFASKCDLNPNEKYYGNQNP